MPEVGLSEDGVYCKICLRVKLQDVKFKDPKFKHEILMRIDMKHPTSQIISSIFSVVEL